MLEFQIQPLSIDNLEANIIPLQDAETVACADHGNGSVSLDCLATGLSNQDLLVEAPSFPKHFPCRGRCETMLDPPEVRGYTSDIRRRHDDGHQSPEVGQ